MKNALVSSRFEKSQIQVEPGVIIATKNFKRNLLLISYREGEKNPDIHRLFPPATEERDKKTIWHLQPISSVWRPLAFLPVTLSTGKMPGPVNLHTAV